MPGNAPNLPPQASPAAYDATALRGKLAEIIAGATTGPLTPEQRIALLDSIDLGVTGHMSHAGITPKREPKA